MTVRWYMSSLDRLGLNKQTQGLMQLAAVYYSRGTMKYDPAKIIGYLDWLPVFDLMRHLLEKRKMLPAELTNNLGFFLRSCMKTQVSDLFLAYLSDIVLTVVLCAGITLLTKYVIQKMGPWSYNLCYWLWKLSTSRKLTDEVNAELRNGRRIFNQVSSNARKRVKLNS